MMSVGLLFRIQTMVIFFFLLYIEYDNDCRVSKGAEEPLSYAEVENQESNELSVMDVSRLFNYTLIAIFLTSLRSSVLYIKKTLLYLHIRKNNSNNNSSLQRQEHTKLESRYRLAQILQILVMCGSQLSFFWKET